MNEYQMTHEALKELQDELDQLKTVGRAEMAEKIKVALSFGDLSENAEYDEAKSEQGKMESRINELEELIRNAVIVDDEAHEEGTVGRSSVVKIKNLDTKEEVTYRLVGFTQSDPLAGKISDESPVGKALIGKRVGDVIEVEAPRGKMSFKILEVAKSVRLAGAALLRGGAPLRRTRFDRTGRRQGPRGAAGADQRLERQGVRAGKPPR